MAATHKLPINYVPENSFLVFIKQTSQATFDSNGKILTYTKGLYRCICGIEKEMIITNVKLGKIRSCGCYAKKEASHRNTTHGLGKHPLMRIWGDMKTRCYNKKSFAYEWYGGRGVTVCEEWKDSFINFYNWAISMKWEKGLRLDKDKIAKEKGVPAILYSPEMCCFLTHKENCNNRSSNHLITYKGETRNLTQWEIHLGLPQEILYNRLKRGWSIERAIEYKVRKHPNRK